MILLCGIPSETPMQLVAHAAEDLGVEFVHLNQRQAAHLEITIEVWGGHIGGYLQLPQGEISLERVRGAYVRLIDWQILPEHRPRGRRPPDAVEASRSAGFHSTLIQWLDVAPIRVANRVSAMASNVSKPYQGKLLEYCGLRTPATLVTNCPDDVVGFAQQYGTLVYKSISSTRSIVKVLDREAMRRLEQIRVLPTQFQERVEGVDVRVHVVGDVAFATEILTEAIDYRYAAREGTDVRMRPLELPKRVEEACLKASRLLDLPFCGLDLKLTSDGDFVCFEANPAPAFSYFQNEGGQPIAEAVVRWLAHS